MLVKLINQPHRRQTGTALEAAVLRNDVHTISSILASAERIPMYLFYYAASLGAIDAFDCMFGLLSSNERKQLTKETYVTSSALLNKQFPMFEYLVYTHSFHFKFTQLVKAHNLGVKQALPFLLTTCFAMSDKGWFNPTSSTTLTEDGYKFTSIPSGVDPIQVLFNNRPCYYETMHILHPDEYETFFKYKHSVFRELLFEIGVLDLETVIFIFEHPDCPPDLHRLAIYSMNSVNDMICKQIELLQYFHNKYNLVEMFSPSNIETHCECDYLFYNAIQHGAYDCCDELIRIGLPPTPRCWEGIACAREGVNRLQAYEYLHRSGVPFYSSETEATFDNIFPYVEACVKYVVQNNKSELDFLQRIKFPICASSAKLLARPLVEFLSDIHSVLRKDQDGTVKRYISCENTDETSVAGDEDKVDKSWYVASNDLVKGRVFECINLLLSLGCTWANVKLDTEEFFAEDVFLFSCLTKYLDMTPEVVWLFIMNNHRYSLDVALYCLVKFRYSLSIDKISRALKRIDFEVPAGSSLSIKQDVLVHWYDDLNFREFALEIMSPLGSHDDGITVSSKMLKDFSKYCKQVSALCDKTCEVFKACDLGVIDDVVSTVVCEYL